MKLQKPHTSLQVRVVNNRRRWLMMVSIISIIVVCGCDSASSSHNDAESAASDYLSQFSSLSLAGPDQIWLVTLRGELLSVTKDGKFHRADVGSGKTVLVSFIDRTRGWALNTDSRIWNTVDEGRSWNLVFTPAASENFYQPQQLIFVDEFHGWVIGLFAVWQTVDGGKTWTKTFSVAQAAEERIGRLYRGIFVSNDSGWISSSGAMVLQTNDAGQSWKPLSPTSDETDLHDVAFVDQKSGWVIGRPNGGIYSTSDGGTTWRHQFGDEGLHLNSVSFVDTNEGWACGWRSVGEPRRRKAIILHTVNGGTTWRSPEAGIDESVFVTIKFSDKEQGWLAGRDKLYRTDNAGNSWRIVLSLPPIVNK